MSRNYDHITQLLDEAARSSDPAKLRKIAAELQRYSQWDDAELVREKARDIERQYAEMAAK